MRILSKKLAVVTVLLVGTFSAHAQGREPRIVPFIGTGTLSCGEFIKHKEANNSVQMDLFVQWSWGFMSAYSMRDSFVAQWKGASKTGDLRSMPDSSTVLLFLEKHCREKPLDNILAATVALTKALGGNVIWKE